MKVIAVVLKKEKEKEKKKKEKNQACTMFELVTSALPVQCSTNCDE